MPQNRTNRKPHFPFENKLKTLEENKEEKKTLNKEKARKKVRSIVV
jgi:hypothetical protein